MTLRKLLAEPLVHFLLLGGALFFAYRIVNEGAVQAPTTIVVAKDQVEALARQHELTWQRPPTDAELKGLVDRWVLDEILFREGLSAGVDRGDPVVRRRVVQKMQYLFEDMATEVPTDEELHAWLEANRASYRQPPVYSLEQVLLGDVPAGAAGQVDVDRALSRLRSGRIEGVGLASVLPSNVDRADAGRLENLFGREFVEGLNGLPVGTWSGPVRSAYGSHAVRISRLESGRDPTLDEVRQQVVDDVQRARRETIKEALHDSLRARYTVVVEADAKGMPAAAASAEKQRVQVADAARESAP